MKTEAGRTTKWVKLTSSDPESLTVAVRFVFNKITEGL